MSEPVKSQRCAVCGFTLSQFVPTGGGPSSWRHEREADQDHIPVPVDRDQLPGRARCDFCDHEGDTPWLIVLVGPITQLATETELHVDSPYWAACEPCKSDITRKRWTSVYSRNAANAKGKPGEHMPGRRKYLLAMWSRVDAAILAIVPFSEELVQDEPIQTD